MVTRTETNDPLFTISRTFDAPRELVFEAWTNPEHVRQWWGPRPFTAPICEMDLRPGGAYKIVMRGPDGVDYPVTGVFVEIVKPERIVAIMDCRTHPAAFHDMVMPDRDPENVNPVGIMLQTVTLEDVGGKTKLTVTIRFESAAIRDAMLKMDMEHGWSKSLEQMAEHLRDLSGRDKEMLARAVEPGPWNEACTITVRREFSLPAEKVFDAWLNLGDWMFTTPTGQLLKREVDPRLGGKFVVIEQRDNHVAEHYGNYVILDRPRQLAFTFYTNFSLDSTLVNIDIVPTMAGCQLTLKHSIDPAWAEFLPKVQTGWTKILESLSQAL